MIPCIETFILQEAFILLKKNDGFLSDKGIRAQSDVKSCLETCLGHQTHFYVSLKDSTIKNRRESIKVEPEIPKWMKMFQSFLITQVQNLQNCVDEEDTKGLKDSDIE